MAHAYQSAEDGQIVISDEPRRDLEGLARWQEIDVDEAQAIIDSREDEPAEIDEDVQRLIDYLTENDFTPADAIAALSGGRVAATAEDVTAPAAPAEAKASTPEAPAGNASTEKWADYARELGVAIDEDASRDQIKAAIDAHKAAQ